MNKEFIVGALRGRNPDNPSERGRSLGRYRQRLEFNTNGTTNTLTSVQKDNLVMEKESCIVYDDYNSRIRKDQNTIGTLTCNIGNSSERHGFKIIENMEKKRNFRIRKLTPKECFRLMGVDDKDIEKIQSAGISNSQQYKMAGNSIVVDVLDNIFESLLFPEEEVLELLP